MRKCLIVLFLVSSFWSAAYSATAANETGQQTPPGEPSETICQMSDAARDAIDSATAVVVKKEGTAEALELIYQAKKAARPPECDSAKAKMLADKAKRAPSETDPKIVEAIYTSPLLTTTTIGMSLIWPFAITTEAFGGEDKIAFRKIQQYRFVTIVRDNLAGDMAKGGGEYVSAMAYLHGCPVEVLGNYAQMTQRKFKYIFPRSKLDIETILTNLETQVAKDPLLATECRWVS